MKSIIIFFIDLCLVFYAVSGRAAIIAKIDDSREVVLFENDMWQYAKDIEEKENPRDNWEAEQIVALNDSVKENLRKYLENTDLPFLKEFGLTARMKYLSFDGRYKEMMWVLY